MRILSYNINGLRALLKKNVIEILVEEYKPDIILFQELKTNEKQFFDSIQNTILVQQYPHVYVNCSQDLKGYSGVAVFSKIKPKQHITNLPDLGEGTDEGRLIVLEFNKFILVNVYTPNSGANLKRLDLRTRTWDKVFKEIILDLSKQNDVIVMGDLNVACGALDIHNVKIKRAGHMPQEKIKFHELLEEADLIDTFRYLHPTTKKYTYFSARQNGRGTNRGWRIDYALVSQPLLKHVKDSIIIEKFNESDHDPILLQIL